MKIAIFSDNFYPELSGISDSITLLAQTLAERGHQVMIVAPRYSKADYKTVDALYLTEPNYGQQISFGRLSAVRYPGSPTGQGRIAFPVGQGVSLMRKFRPDVIHTHTPFGTGLEALFASKILGIPLVGTNHTPFSEYSPFQAVWFLNTIWCYFSWYYNRCSFVSAPCKALMDEMRAHGFDRPHQAVPNSINLQQFFPPTNHTEKEILKKKFNLTKNTLLYTGRLAKEKNVDVIIRALARVKKTIPDISLAIAGHGSDEKSLRALVQELELEKEVIFLGFLEKEMLSLLYKASDLFVIMSTAESQSLSLIQAMASGLAVIGADARALPEYINEENGIIVPPGDDITLAAKITEILTNKEYKERLETGGVTSAAQFNPTTITKQWEEIYTRAIVNYHHVHTKN